MKIICPSFGSMRFAYLPNPLDPLNSCCSRFLLRLAIFATWRKHSMRQIPCLLRSQGVCKGSGKEFFHVEPKSHGVRHVALGPIFIYMQFHVFRKYFRIFRKKNMRDRGPSQAAPARPALPWGPWPRGEGKQQVNETQSLKFTLHRLAHLNGTCITVRPVSSHTQPLEDLTF